MIPNVAFANVSQSKEGDIERDGSNNEAMLEKKKKKIDNKCHTLRFIMKEKEILHNTQLHFGGSFTRKIVFITISFCFL